MFSVLLGAGKLGCDSVSLCINTAGKHKDDHGTSTSSQAKRKRIESVGLVIPTLVSLRLTFRPAPRNCTKCRTGYERSCYIKHFWFLAINRHRNNKDFKPLSSNNLGMLCSRSHMRHANPRATRLEPCSGIPGRIVEKNPGICLPSKPTHLEEKGLTASLL